MQPSFTNKLKQVIFNERLDAYYQRGTPQTDLNLFSHYAWNIALSQSPYPALQGL